MQQGGEDGGNLNVVDRWHNGRHEGLQSAVRHGQVATRWGGAMRQDEATSSKVSQGGEAGWHSAVQQSGAVKRGRAVQQGGVVQGGIVVWCGGGQGDDVMQQGDGK